jgi:hypothetical protein
MKTRLDSGNARSSLDEVPGQSVQPSDVEIGQLLECSGREVQGAPVASTAAIGDADSNAFALPACLNLLVADGVLVRVSVGAREAVEVRVSNCGNEVVVAVVGSAGVQTSAVEGGVTSVSGASAAVVVIVVVVSRGLGLGSGGSGTMSGSCAVGRSSGLFLLRRGGGFFLFGGGGCLLGQNAGRGDGGDGSSLGSATTGLCGTPLGVVVRGGMSLHATGDVIMMASDSSGTVLGSEGAQNEGGSSEKCEDGEFHSGLLLSMKVVMWTTGQTRAPGWK